MQDQVQEKRYYPKGRAAGTGPSHLVGIRMKPDEMKRLQKRIRKLKMPTYSHYVRHLIAKDLSD